MNIEAKKINVGIGFVTGRKNFKNVLKSYLNHWNDAGLLDKRKYALHLFVAYDLKYTGTEASDYKITEEEILGTVDSAHYLGNVAISGEARELVEKKVITTKEAKLIFGEGYGMKRNAVLYVAIKNKMDYLIFLDDDEYPIVNIPLGDGIAWKGQEVLSTHIQNIGNCNMTHGHHCGYISPIPGIGFNDTFTELDFKQFIETISNDIINWDSVRAKMNNGGVSFGDLEVMNNQEISLVQEVDGMKFISGANLGFNLHDLDKLFPFYNPPGARGEDTFLSTCIGSCEIRKVPCYTFHDSYQTYSHLLNGVLPNQLKAMTVTSASVYKRFLRASIGWIRYKPLYLYITQRDDYTKEIQKMRQDLSVVIPKICRFFGNDDFMGVQKELDRFDGQVEAHYRDFQQTKAAWIKVMDNIKENNQIAKVMKRGKQ